MVKKAHVSSQEGPTVTEPRLGDQIVPPPNTPVVTDPKTPSGLPIPQEPPVSADPNVIADAPPAEAPPAPEPEGQDLPLTTSILLESGARIDLGYTKRFNDFRVRALPTGRYYEHVADAPDGEWVYRPCN